MLAAVSLVITSNLAFLAPPAVGAGRGLRNGIVPCMIVVGDALPDVQLEVTTANGGEAQKISEILGSGGPSVLVGVPGAFTPTCTDRHLPGYYERLASFSSLGVETIHVVTANDKWVNVAWQQKLEECMGSSELGASLRMIADPAGELLEALGMIAYLGKDFGVRSKRFALIVDSDGVVQHTAVDAGTDTLLETAADRVLDADFFKELRDKLRATTEQAVAAHLFSMSAGDAVDYLTSEPVQQQLANGFVPETTVDEALAVIRERKQRDDVRTLAEQQVAAHMTTLDALEAYNYLVSSQTLQKLQKAGVPKSTIAASLAVLKEAIPEGASPAKLRALPPSYGSEAASAGGEANVGGLLGALTLAAAGATIVAQQQGLVDLSSVQQAVSNLAAAPTASLSQAASL